MSSETPVANGHTSTETANGSGCCSQSFRDSFRRILKPFASLQVTVVLFALSLVLVFFGTMAQTSEGIWTVVDKYFRSDVVWIPNQLLAKFGIIFFDLDHETQWSGGFYYPGGWTLGALMLINLLAAHLLRFRVTWKRSGILLTHAGIVVLMVGELITGLYAVESTMTLSTGETTNFVDETLNVELVVEHSPDGKVNDVIKIPGSRLKKRGLISDPQLPVDIEVLEYWKNSNLEERQGPPPDESWYVHSTGNRYKLYERPESAGVDPRAKGDAPTARINVRKKGADESLGTFQVSLWYYPNFNMNSRLLLFPKTQFDLDGKRYTLELRNRREYKPYSVRLLKFEHTHYKGSDINRDFASTVELIDPGYGANREYRISMNNPLRFRQDSLYQFQVMMGDSGTVLQVVRNPGRLMPYLGWIMVTLGLIIHFVLMLSRFLSKVKEQAADSWGNMRYLFPIGGVLLALCWMVPKAIVKDARPDNVDYYGAGKLPVLQEGRMKPLDTVARVNLQAISGKSEVQDENKKFVATAMEWYIDVFDSRKPFEGKASEYKIFRIDNDQILSLLKLEPRPEFFRYSLKEIEPRYDVFQTELEKVQAKDENVKTALDSTDELISLLKKTRKETEQLTEKSEERFKQLGRVQFSLMQQLEDLRIAPMPDKTVLKNAYRKAAEAMESGLKLIAEQNVAEAVQKQDEALKQLQEAGKALEEFAKTTQKLDLRDNKILELGKKLKLYHLLAQGKVPGVVPPEAFGETWQTMDSIDKKIEFTQEEKKKAFDDAMKEVAAQLKKLNRTIDDLTPEQIQQTERILRSFMHRNLANEAPLHRDRVSAAAAAFTNLMKLGKDRDPEAFNKALTDFQKEHVKGLTDEESKKIGYEAYFNHLSPFFQCAMLYIMVILIACPSWMVLRSPLNLTAFWLCVLTFGLHSAAILTRMYLQGRPPVTNLYSSAIFIGWGSIALCLFIERVYRNGIATVVGATLGALTMFIAHRLAENTDSGDTMEPLVAVLDTDFWLATHVVCVTLGYVATFVAGFLAIGCVGYAVTVSLGTASGVLKDDPVPELKKVFYKMIYGVVCFATLLSFTGTVLGGLWADYSWGRFWGWDSKENGAVMVVVWNALILHARWAGLIKLRGMATLALVGNMITMWSWFGTNQLQTGLHSYGFSSDLAAKCRYVWLVSMGLIVVALLPLSYWRDGKAPAKANTTKT